MDAEELICGSTHWHWALTTIPARTLSPGKSRRGSWERIELRLAKILNFPRWLRALIEFSLCSCVSTVWHRSLKMLKCDLIAMTKFPATSMVVEDGDHWLK